MGFLLTLVILILVFALLFWVIDMLPGDATLKQIAKAVLALVVVIYLLAILFGQAPSMAWPA